jgi:flagellin
MAEVTLSAALRSNLLSNQSTQRLLDATTQRLATGRKVNSALDDVNAFFTSQSLSTRAGDLTRRLDGMGQSIQTLKAADAGLTAMTKVVEQMQTLARQAKEIEIPAPTPPTEISGPGGGLGGGQVVNLPGVLVDEQQLVLLYRLQETFNTLRGQLDALATDAGYRGVNLLNGGNLSTTFNEGGTSSLTISGQVRNSTQLGIPVAEFVNTASEQVGVANASGMLVPLDNALAVLREVGRSLNTNLTVIQTRQEFTENLINALKEGSDKLTLADSNEEGATLVALQTRQQLGTTALSLAAQSQQAVLRLFVTGLDSRAGVLTGP